MSDNTNTNPYNRPLARFSDDARLELRASALGRCRRALWYSATEQPITNPASSRSLTILESGNALEPVVINAMQRDGWRMQPIDRDAPAAVSVELGGRLIVTGHPDATGFLPVTSADAIDRFLFDDGAAEPNSELVIEVKTRGPEAFKRWQTLGAERSHPESVAQAASYSLGLYGECRDVVIATLDTGSRSWGYEVIPAERVHRAWLRTGDRLAPLADHLEAQGPDPDVLPDRDFTASDWQCRSCPYLDACQPEPPVGTSPGEFDTEPTEPVSDEQAQQSLWRYEELSELIKSLNADKRQTLETLERWLEAQGASKATLDGREKPRTIGKVTSRRYKVDHKRLNALLDPEQRAEIVTENRSEYVRVS